MDGDESNHELVNAGNANEVQVSVSLSHILVIN